MFVFINIIPAWFTCIVKHMSCQQNKIMYETSLKNKHMEYNIHKKQLPAIYIQYKQNEKRALTRDFIHAHSE